MAHDPQTPNASAGIAAQVEDQSRGSKVCHRKAHVARDVHSEHARKHAHADQPNIVRKLRCRDDLIRNDDRALLFL
jgi:hypothetical protein